MSRRRKRSCGGKRRYRDQDEALRASRYVARTPRHAGRDGHRPTRAYHCGRCNGWHLTHQERR